MSSSLTKIGMKQKVMTSPDASYRRLDETFRRCMLNTIAIPLLVINTLGYAMDNPTRITYISPLGDENWRMTGSRLRCGLSLTIPNYGIAYFEQYAARPPHFILSKWEQVERQLPATVMATPPMWKPFQKPFFISNTVISPGKYGIYLSRDPALKALTFLAQGYQTIFQYISEQKFAVTVSISPVNFQKVYARYQQCLGNLLPFGFNKVAKSIFRYDVDSFMLSEEDKDQLDKVAEYCQADTSIKKINIAGYTDDTGRRSYNNAISEYRAKEVEKYLLKKGIREYRIHTIWFGIKDPVASNETEEGRAANRRVEIILSK